MLRPALLLLSALLLAPASASAAPGEVAPVSFSGEGVCTRVTATPGEVAVTTSTGVSFVRATRDGLEAAETITFGELDDCPDAATTANGAGVVAGMAGEQYVYAALRDPGGAWSEPRPLTSESAWLPEQIAVAVSERGDAIVAWLEQRDRDGANDFRIRVSRRAPGGALSPPAIVSARSFPTPGGIATGISATGEAVVMWRQSTGPSRAAVTVAVTDATGAFAAPTRIAELPQRSSPALAVAADGRAIVALGDGKTVSVAERPPGGRFGAPTPVATARDRLGVQTAAALAPSGDAVVAWSTSTLGGSFAVTRRGVSGFGAGTTLAPPNRRPAFDRGSAAAIFGFPPPGRWAIGGASIRASLTGDGRALLAWIGPRVAGGVGRYVANLAAVPLDGHPPAAFAIGGELMNAANARPLLLPDGTAGVVWTDEPRSERLRLRLAADGAAATEAALPRVRVGRPARRVLRAGAPLDLPVRCDAPCEVRGQIVGQNGTDATLRLPKAGTGRLRIEALLQPIAPRRLGRVSVRLTSGAVDGRRTEGRTLDLRLVRAPTPPDPRVVELKAVRRGRTVEVTWRTDRPTTDTLFTVLGDPDRDWMENSVALDLVDGPRGRSSFSATLRPQGSARVGWVRVVAFTDATRGLHMSEVRVS